MVLQEKKIKLEEQILPRYMKELSEKSFSNPDVIRIRQMLVEQMEESIFNTGQIWFELDQNKDGILDIVQDERLIYIFEGLPITSPMKQYFSKIEQYFHASERQKEKLIRKLIEALEYADKTREIVKLVPVETTRLGDEEVERFKIKIKAKIIAYKEGKTKIEKGVMFNEIQQEATTEEKKVWINSVAMEEMGEEILK